MTTIAEVEQLLAKMKEDEADNLRRAAEQRMAEREAAEAAKAADDAKLRVDWEENQKRGRIRVVVPDGANAPTEYSGHGRTWINHRGETVHGVDPTISAIENGQHVVYLRNFNDFRSLLRGPQGFLWERSNPDALRRMAEVMPKNNPPIG